MKAKPPPNLDLKVFLSKTNSGNPGAHYRTNDRVFVQGDTADAVFYIEEGKVKLTVLSKQEKRPSSPF